MWNLALGFLITHTNNIIVSEFSNIKLNNEMIFANISCQQLKKKKDYQTVLKGHLSVFSSIAVFLNQKLSTSVFLNSGKIKSIKNNNQL